MRSCGGHRMIMALRRLPTAQVFGLASFRGMRRRLAATALGVCAVTRALVVALGAATGHRARRRGHRRSRQGRRDDHARTHQAEHEAHGPASSGCARRPPGRSPSGTCPRGRPRERRLRRSPLPECADADQRHGRGRDSDRLLPGDASPSDLDGVLVLGLMGKGDPTDVALTGAGSPPPGVTLGRPRSRSRAQLARPCGRRRFGAYGDLLVAGPGCPRCSGRTRGRSRRSCPALGRRQEIHVALDVVQDGDDPTVARRRLHLAERRGASGEVRGVQPISASRRLP